MLLVHARRFVISHPSLLLLACAFALGAGPVGCASFKKKPEVFVPVQKTAKDQFRYAVREREKNEIALRNKSERERMEAARESVRKAYEAVPTHFPEDREFTPLARLELADMKAGIDTAGFTASNRDIRQAISMLEKIQKDYAEIEFVQAKSRFDQAYCYKKIKEFDKAQAIFREITETYAKSKDKDVRRIVANANYHYQQTYVKK